MSKIIVKLCNLNLEHRMFDENNSNTIFIYKWNSNFKREQIIREIQKINCILQNKLLNKISQCLKHHAFSFIESQCKCFKRNLFSLTTLIHKFCAHQTYSHLYFSNLSSIQTKIIVFSILINDAFEIELRNFFNKMIDVSFVFKKLFNHLIAIHQFSNSSSINVWILLQFAKSLNLKFWFIEKSNMWVDQHRIFDEIFQFLWFCYKWFRFDMIDNEFNVLHFARIYWKRIVLLEISNVREN